MSSSSRNKKDSVPSSSRAENIRRAKSVRLNRIIGQRFGMLVVETRAENIGAAAAWVCKCDCGQTKVVRGYCLRTGQKSCGCLLRGKGKEWRLRTAAKGDRTARWKGGRFYRRGYVFLSNPDYPGAPTNKRYWCAREHVVVMSRSLGRPLLRTETVHHKNGVKDDNRLENLELWSSSHPAGQRVEDKVRWAREILARYT